jgi:hypothetical protein
MIGTKPALVLSLLLTGLTNIATASVRVPLNVDMDGSGWKHVNLPNVPAARFAPQPDGALIADTMGAFGMIYYALRDIDRLSVLSWRWRVDRPLPPTDAARKGGDDRPLALHVWFPLPPSATGFWSRLGDGVAQILGAPPAGRVITYMWGGAHRSGESFKNPHLADHGWIVVRRGTDAPAGSWVMETIDLAADYERLYGGTPPPPIYLAISADSDDTGEKSRAAIADIVFTARSAP